MDIIDQMSKGYKKLSKKSKMLEQELNEKSNENKELVDELDALKKSKECKGLEQELKALRKSFDEIQASHECLKEDHEDLEIAHSRLKKAHSTLLELIKKKDIMLEKLKKKFVVEQVIVTCDVGLTCDLIDDSFHSPIVVESANPSCSTFTSTSTISDGFTCDASLIVENETLKKEVNELNHC
jgi:ABC-type phosphate transport system auxiliary subunit